MQCKKTHYKSIDEEQKKYIKIFLILILYFYVIFGTKFVFIYLVVISLNSGKIINVQSMSFIHPTIRTKYWMYSVFKNKHSYS